MIWKSINQLADDIKTGKTTAVELTKQALQLIEDNSEYNALITINPKALEVAEEIDRKLNDGEQLGVLAGIPYIAKDNFLTRGLRTTAASNILDNFIPPNDAVAIQKLNKAGAILVAKSNLDSFAHGSSTENSDMGPTLNPHDKLRVPGGSSGGSAAAVVLGLAPFALGTDTGGSIRLPASFTGSVGYKPTYGLVSRFGVVAMASSTDVIGPIANSVEDVALVLDVISGRDPLDSTTIERDEMHYSDFTAELKGKKIGVISEYMGDGLEDDVRASVESALNIAKETGATVSEVSMPQLQSALAVYYIVMPAEVSSNLSRYDGIRYGHSSEAAQKIDEVYELSRTEGFNDEVKRRIMVGTYVLSSGYYDAFYKKAQQVRTLLIKEFTKAFESFDYLIGPTSPTTAFKLGENTDDPLKMYLADIMTVSANLVGVPAISIPCGKDGKGLPIGLQIMAPQRHDRDLLSVANVLEQKLEYNS